MNKYFKKISTILVILLIFNIIPTKAIKVQAITEVENVNDKIDEKSSKTKKEKKIIKELVEKRESNVKYFLLEDNTYEMAVYNEPVHYYKDGNWEDIDNNLSESEDKIFWKVT